MNPNNQQPYYNFHQHTPGPPQPSWQAPPRQQGWGDPRISSPVTTTPASPFSGHGYTQTQAQNLPPPPPLPPGGFPAPQVNAPQQNTSAWGVRYNQGQPYAPQHEDALRPPLPPRPSSGQSGQTGWSSQASQHGPVPPPRPPEYAAPHQAQGQYFPHEQYSHRPTSHHYEPQTGQWPAAQEHKLSGPTWLQAHSAFDAPISPIESAPQGWQSQTTAPAQSNPNYGQPGVVTQDVDRLHVGSIPQTGASAIGSGGPSDWQHFPGDDQYYQDQAHQQSQQHLQLQAPTQGQVIHPYTATPEQVHVVPDQANLQHLRQDSVQSSVNPTSAPQQAQNHFSMPSVEQRHLGSTPPDRARYGSDATANSFGPPARSGTIDSVMNAWQASAPKLEPLKAASRPTSAPPPRQVSSTQTQTDFPPIVKTETKIVTKVETREIDPYEDLKNEYRTSLNRYATMLRQEMAAQTEQEKMTIVFNYVNREVKLRAILFNAEPAELVKSSELAELRKTADKAKEEETMRMPANASQSRQVASDPRAMSPKRPHLDTNTPSHNSRDDGFVVVNADDAEYSPGGRPRVVAVPREAPQRRPSPAIQAAPRAQKPSQPLVQPPSPASNAPMTLDDYAMPDQPSGMYGNQKFDTPAQVQRPGSVGPPPSSKPQVPIPFQPARPAYTPFTYGASAQTALPMINSQNPADQAYTKLRQGQAVESGRLLSQDTPSLVVAGPDRSQSATPSRAKRQQEEAFIGLLRKQTQAVRRPQTVPPSDAPAPLRAGTPLRRRQSLPPLVKASETLRQSLPINIPQLNFANQTHPKLAPIGTAVAGLTDDFSFIHAIVVAWDKDNRKHRQTLDAERASRESESQARIDDLFHDNQIGYADIAGLEEDSKIDEASKKYQEDQDELESFSRNVFEKVSQRLEKERAELETLRVKTLDVLDLGSSSASARLRTAITNPQQALEKAPLAAAMNMMLHIYQKIEMRQTKIAEAHFERERRRKRLELSVLYTNGDTVGVKKLEKDFDKAQSMQVLSEARNRDERANKLMDSFDRAVVRGLAENQEWIDDISNKASLLRDLVLGSETNGPQGRDREDLLYGPAGVRETFDLLSDATSIVSQDSRDLVQTSTQADKILNEADFAMFIAEAKIADADDKEFEKLQKEKVKEDQKLKEEAEGRMSGIQRGPDEILGYVNDVRDFIGSDKGHPGRINHALERAKERNQGQGGNTPAGGVGAIREI